MYTINYDPAALLIYFFCLIYSLGARRKQYIPPKGFRSRMLNQHFVFMLILQASIVAAAASAAVTYLTDRPASATYGLMFWLNEVFFLAHTMLAAFLTLYFMNVNGSALGRRRAFYLGFAIPFLCGEAVILMNPLTKLVFYLDQDLIYHRGPVMPLLYLLSLSYIATGFFYFFRYRRAISKAESIVIVCIVGLAIIGVVVQALRPDLLVELFFESLAILALMIIAEDHTGLIDPETQAFNRRAFNDANQRLLATGQRYSIVLIKFTNVHFIQRLFSSRDVVRLMADVATWLETVVDRESIFRFWQEGFALIVRDGADTDANEAAVTVRERFESSWTLRGVTTRLDARVGIIRMPDDAPSLQQLQDLLISDLQHVQPGSQLMTRSQMIDLKRSLAVEDVLRNAIAEDRLEVRYQPLWSPESGTVVAAEALVRLRDPQGNYISPEEFIPVAEKTDLIHEIGRHVFAQACRVLSENDLASRGIRYIDINLSIYQFLKSDLVAGFDRIRGEWNVRTDQINFEITEGLSPDEVASVDETIERMIAMGYSFSIDDYGTGYSNLSRLLEQKYANVKIDKSILWGGDDDPATARLLANLIGVIRGMGTNVVQEGVETKAQLDRAVGAGANLIQGFYFSKPLPEAEFLAYLDKVNGAGV